MIPAHQPATAHFRHETPTLHHTSKPVLAWDDDGHPLVASDKHGSLVPASTYSNYAGISAGTADNTVGAIPGGGWMVRYSEDDGGTFDEPILAWLVTSAGDLNPVAVDSDGWVDNPKTSGNFKAIYHPDRRSSGGDDGDSPAP